MIAVLRTLLILATRFVVGGHARWEGSHPTRDQRIYFANHGSHLDTIVLWAALPAPLRETTFPVAARDYWGKTPMRRFIALKVLNCILIDRHREGGTDPLEPLKASLASGHSLVIFPEGTRGEEPLPGRFKAGLYNLAAAFPGVDLLPVYLDNLSRAFPKGAYLPAPISCTARFGPVMRLGGGEERGIFLERARQAVAALADKGA